ncbi:MAG: hypothetical protein JWO81_3096, partial [Alphaproteobacteria bacterium]|nr:hypothetical protein [Alphaproteobacteria bacterium]
MTEISLFRLYALRIVYFLILLFLGTTIWPGIVHHQLPWTLMSGVAHCMLAAVGVMALIGIFRPLRMLPVLFYEIAWKATW